MTTFRKFSRRGFLAGAISFPLLGNKVFALNASEAETLISQLSDDVMRVINSGKSEKAMYRDFEKVMQRYADVPIVARQSLGPPWRSASAAERKAYTSAFSGYLSRKYGKRFREFIGSDIKVTGSRKVKSFYVVSSTVKLKGRSPFSVEWQVSDKSGSSKMFNLIIEGINMIKSEREEIGNAFERRGRDMSKLIEYLNTQG